MEGSGDGRGAGRPMSDFQAHPSTCSGKGNDPSPEMGPISAATSHGGKQSWGTILVLLFQY